MISSKVIYLKIRRIKFFTFYLFIEILQIRPGTSVLRFQQIVWLDTVKQKSRLYANNLKVDVLKLKKSSSHREVNSIATMLRI